MTDPSVDWVRWIFNTVQNQVIKEANILHQQTIIKSLHTKNLKPDFPFHTQFIMQSLLTLLDHKFDHLRLFVWHVNGWDEGKYVLLVKRQRPLRKKHINKHEAISTTDSRMLGFNIALFPSTGYIQERERENVDDWTICWYILYCCI